MPNVKKTLISHFFNEEFLLPWWLKHHRALFDHGILIDYHSTDRSRAIIKDLAPDWEVRTSRNAFFNAEEVDAEVMEIERSVCGWKVALNTTEFLCCDDIDRVLREEIANGRQYINCRGVVMADPVDFVYPELDLKLNLVEQRWHGFFERATTLSFVGIPTRSRMLHNFPDGAYAIGRHRSNRGAIYYRNDLLILWFGYSPWTKANIDRKLQIKSKRTQSDIDQKLGWHHDLDLARLEDLRRPEAEKAVDLSRHPLFSAAIAPFQAQRKWGWRRLMPPSLSNAFHPECAADLQLVSVIPQYWTSQFKARLAYWFAVLCSHFNVRIRSVTGALSKKAEKDEAAVKIKQLRQDRNNPYGQKIDQW